jgi:hypothetical protein
MAMQMNWVELIPFYVAKTLPPEMMQAFEVVLAQDAGLQREVQEWRVIASVVWQETDSIAKQLPPLPPEIYEKLGYRRPFADAAMGVSTPDYATYPNSRRPAPRRIQLPITLVAGLLVVVVFGALLIFAANNLNENIEVASAITITGTPTHHTSFAAAATMTAEQVMTQLAIGTVQTLVAFPTNTPIVEPTGLPLTATPRPNLPVQPTTANLSMAGSAVVTPTLFVPPGLPACFVTNQQPSIVNIYAAAQRDSQRIIGQLGSGEARLVFQTTLDNWANIFAIDGILNGWVAFEDVVLSGDCVSVPQPSPTAPPVSVVLTSVPPETFVIVTDIFADVRSGPGLEFTVMMAAARNNTFRVLGMTGEEDAQWFYVLLPNETQGWLWSQQASISEISGVIPVTFTPLSTPSPQGQ